MDGGGVLAEDQLDVDGGARSLLSTQYCQSSDRQTSAAVQGYVAMDWSWAGSPVRLGALQDWLSLVLPKYAGSLLRGKGVFWVEEDPQARFEWQLSGRLRSSVERDSGHRGFGGSAPRSELMLIRKSYWDGWGSL